MVETHYCYAGRQSCWIDWKCTMMYNSIDKLLSIDEISGLKDLTNTLVGRDRIGKDHPIFGTFLLIGLWLWESCGGASGIGTQQPKRIFGYEILFKHDLPHDIESINQKIQLKSLRI